MIDTESIHKGVSVMDAACLAGSRDVLDALADAGAEYGPAQLTIAAAKNRLAVAQWLVGKGVDVNAPGVMEASLCKSDTQRYLVHEGGVLKQCDGEFDGSTSKASGSSNLSGSGEGTAAGTAEAKKLKKAEATGTINFTLSEVK